MSKELNAAAEGAMSLDTYIHLLRSPMLAEERSVVSGCHLLAVDLDSAISEPLTAQAAEQLKTWLPNTVVVGFSGLNFAQLSSSHSHLIDLVDLLATPDHPTALLDAALAQIARQPAASAALVQLLRQSLEVSVDQGLMLESLMYSSLQHGAAFEAWLQQQQPKEVPESDGASVVELQRAGARLTITLNRPRKHNAFSARMRDELCQALMVALVDETVTEVSLEGNGPSFCAGGDLDEFGQARDAALAHLTRTTRSAAKLMDSMAGKITAHLHGACIGAGIELTAFAQRVIADPASQFALPEVGFGLVPGAGGTVSIPRRIGRHRAGLMAISGVPIDAKLALDWGLVDALR